MSALFPSLYRSPVKEKPFEDTADVFPHVENKPISIVSPQIYSSPSKPCREQVNKCSSHFKIPSPCREKVNKYSSPSKMPPALHRTSSSSFLSFAERMRDMPEENIFGQEGSVSLYRKEEDEEETGSEVKLHYRLMICVKTAVCL
jgi:hypothetical protein